MAIATAFALLKMASALKTIEQILPDSPTAATPSATAVKKIFYSYKYRTKVIKLFSGEMFLVNQQRWVTRL